MNPRFFLFTAIVFGCIGPAFLSSEPPLYYGWFMESAGESLIKRIGMSFYDQLLQRPAAVAEMLSNFNIIGNDPASLKDYFSRDGLDSASSTLHVTSMFCGRGSVPECQAYTRDPEVKQAIGKQYFLEMIGFVITPKTIGARVKLSKRQLDVWGQDDREGPTGSIGKCCGNPSLNEREESDVLDLFQPITEKGSRAHITLFCAKGVSPVQTGYDLVAAVNCEEQCKSDFKHFSLAGAKGRYYGGGEFVVYLDQPLYFISEFLAYY